MLEASFWCLIPGFLARDIILEYILINFRKPHITLKSKIRVNNAEEVMDHFTQ